MSIVYVPFLKGEKLPLGDTKVKNCSIIHMRCLNEFDILGTRAHPLS